jgi:MtN3 and saliva related transmembrane protein
LSVTLISVLGGFAAIASTVSFVPQAVKIIRSRQTKDISAGMYAITVTAFALWCAYGVLLGQWPLIAANSICLLLSCFILVMKLLPRRGRDNIADAVTPKG